jgi:hypothetical protein
VRGTNEDMEDTALKMISLHIGLVVESRDLLDEWQRQVDAARPPLLRASGQVA